MIFFYLFYFCHPVTAFCGRVSGKFASYFEARKLKPLLRGRIF